MRTHTSCYESSLILIVCVLVYVPKPWRFPLSCILKFALRLFHWAAALSSKALSRLLLPFLSRPIFLFLSVSLFSLHISFGVFCWFVLMHFHLFRKRLYMDLQPGYTSQIALNPTNLCTLCLLDSCYLSVPTEKAFSFHHIFPPNAYYSTTHSLEIFKSSLYITEVCVQVSLMPLAPHFEKDLEFDLYSVT